MQEPDRQDSLTSMPDQLAILPTVSSSQLSEVVEVPKPQPKRAPQKYSRRLKAILQPKISAKDKYFTSGHGIDETNAIDISKDTCPFIYPKDLDVFAHKIRTKAWRRNIRMDEIHKKCRDKLNMQQRLKKDLLKRLHVEEPGVETMKTILDIDPEYFSTIEGRPIPDNVDIRSYVETVRETLRTKIITGYREDDIMLIDENLLLEQHIINEIRQAYQVYVDTFEEFLYKDHSSAMQLLKEADISTTASYEKYQELRNFEKKYYALRSTLYNSEDKWRFCKMYQKFLYVISPLSWREEKGIKLQEHEGSEINFLSKSDMVDDDNASLTDLLQQFKNECAQEDQPHLYFTDPYQLMDVFRFIEMQNLNSFLHCEELALPLVQIKEGMHSAEVIFTKEIDKLQESIERLSREISWEEERALFLEDLAKKLIDTEFRRIVMDDEVLNLHVFVEDVYETRIGPNDANLSMVEMMKAIEEKYRHELLRMDEVPAEQVALLEGSSYAEHLRIMRLAEKAARQHAELERLTYRLNKAFAKPVPRHLSKEPKNRSALIEPVIVPPPPPRDLTEQEEEFLEFFTDYCKYTDTPLMYGIDIDRHKSSENRLKITTASSGFRIRLSHMLTLKKRIQK